MSDIVGGRYANQNPAWAITGQLNNLAQPDVPAFTNLPPGAGLAGTLGDEAALITKEEVCWPVFLPWGVAIKKLNLFVGGTKTETMTHAFWTVKQGSPIAIGGELKGTLLAESGDLTSSYEPAETTTGTMELKESLLITPENAPNGFVYFGVFIEGTKVGTYASFKTPAAATFKASSGQKVFPWFTNGPLLKGFKTKPASATTPEKTLKEVVDVVINTVCVVQ